MSTRAAAARETRIAELESQLVIKDAANAVLQAASATMQIQRDQAHEKLMGTRLALDSQLALVQRLQQEKAALEAELARRRIADTMTDDGYSSATSASSSCHPPRSPR